MGPANSRWILLLLVMGGATTLHSSGCNSPVYEIPHDWSVEEPPSTHAGGTVSITGSLSIPEQASGGNSVSGSGSADSEQVGGASGVTQLDSGDASLSTAVAGRGARSYADSGAPRKVSGTVPLGGAGGTSMQDGTEVCRSEGCDTTNCLTPPGNCVNTSQGGCESIDDVDVRECSGCADACSLPHSIVTCVEQRCVISACEVGWADCNQSTADGCEANLANDSSHCGACGVSCGDPNAIGPCIDGECTIAPCGQGKGDCNQVSRDGCEADLQSDPENCGACGVVCTGVHGSPRCKDGACNTDCGAGYADCDDDIANGCETETLSSVEHCGGCRKPCAGTCKEGTCSATPCSGLCENPTVITIGMGATIDISLKACHESYQATNAFVSGNCGQLAKGRKLYVNGVTVNCDTLPWEFSATGKPVPRYGGYCFHDDGLGSNGDFAWLNTW